MSLNVRLFESADETAWDSFARDSMQATLLHSRRFLSYHGERFSDCSLIIESDGACVGLFPAALSPAEKGCVVSHPGATYGGVVHQGVLRGTRMIEALTSVADFYRVQGFSRLVYKSVPRIYHRTPAEDDLYALFRLGARRTRCDLSCAINLRVQPVLAERRRRSLKKAKKHGVEVRDGTDQLSAFWKVLSDNLASRHHVAPVHTFDEIALLANRFPDDIRCICGWLDGEVVAGVLHFITPTSHHAQYIASNQKGHAASALDLIFDCAIQAARAEGKQWYDFGISNENHGAVLNDGLYRFKSEFGGGGAVHEFYELALA